MKCNTYNNVNVNNNKNDCMSYLSTLHCTLVEQSKPLLVAKAFNLPAHLFCFNNQQHAIMQQEAVKYVCYT